MYILSLFLSITICQLSSVPFKVLEKKDTYRIKQFQDQLFAISSYIPNELHQIHQYNLSLGILIETFTTNQTFHAIEIYNQTLIIGLSSGLITFQLPINHFQQSPFKHYFSTTDMYYYGISDIYTIGISDSYIITSPGVCLVDKWDIKTFQILESVFLPFCQYYNYALIHKNSLFISARTNYQTRYMYEIQEYNMTSLTQKLYSYNSELAGALFKLEIRENSIFVGSELTSVFQWNLQTKQFGMFYSAHLSYTVVYDFVLTDDYIFAVCNGLWIQFEISSGAIIRQVSSVIGSSVVLIDPILFVAGIDGGIIAYRIPELNGTYSFDDWLVGHTTTRKAISTLDYVTTNSEVLTWNQPTSTTFLAALKPKKTLQQQQQSNGNISFEVLTPYIVGAIVFILLVFLLVCILLRRQKIKKELSLSATTTTTATLSTSVVKTTSETTGFTSASSMNTSSNLTSQSTSYSDSKTLFTTQNIYSIPGYLGIKPDEIRQLKQIAKGGQGTIFIGELLNPALIRKHGKTVIVKSMNHNYNELSERQQNCFMQEISIIHYFRDCKGVVDLFCYTLEPTVMVLKYYPFGSLENILRRTGSFTQFSTSKKFVIVFLYEISKTISLLHDSGFVHCDLKPQNILLEQDPSGLFHPILTDFGITQIVTDKVMQVKEMNIENLKGFSLRYAAPEQIKQLREKNIKPFYPNVIMKRDIYAIGSILYAFLSLKEPWDK